MSDKMEWWAALVEWESCGLDDIPTENLLEFQEALSKEINKRKSKGPLPYQGIGGLGGGCLSPIGTGGAGLES